MGGSGSSRWKSHNRKTEIEECLRLSIIYYRQELHRIGRDLSTDDKRFYRTWTQDGSVILFLRLDIERNSDGLSAWVAYTLSRNNQTPIDKFYSIGLDWTPAQRNSKQWWWACPICHRRCAHLYLPPGESVFACRRCHDLAYYSQHHNNGWKKYLRSLNLSTPEERYLEWVERFHAEQEVIQQARFTGYLTTTELCQQSGLSEVKLAALVDARLIVPDAPDGRFRPKLAGWAKKLAYLLSEGWSMEKIKDWSKSRWSQPNPRQWPPVQENEPGVINQDDRSSLPV